MVLIIPNGLSGENLGQRHRYLNSLVDQAAAGGLPQFQDIEALTEQTAVDQLFKIDLAIKLKNVDYILKTLKDDDMLYVSRALKCKWLLERRDLINPKYLEDVLFPEMVMPAITKMKHWLYINLTDPLICEEFYQYYKSKKLDFALKFLSHCGNEFLLNEFPKILTKVTPHLLKVLGEKNPKLVKIYFDSLATNNDLVKQYVTDEHRYYDSIKSLLKLDSDTFFDITEKYHSLCSDNKLSPLATDYILRYHKNRFMTKSELYVAYLVHLPTVAQRLSIEECQELVIKLACADYLNWWFSYEKVESLVKRIGRDNRAAFKRKVFVDKDIGERVTEWPYTLPASPVMAARSNKHIFCDQDFEPINMLQRQIEYRLSALGGQSDSLTFQCSAPCMIKMKSELQKLFDEFRVVGFEATLHELRGRIGAVSSADRRRDMLLVLVSKSGGHTDNVRALLELALRLGNEPVHERAAIIRSLVKRASVWRLPQDVWDSMLEYGHGLGLDGTIPEAPCLEGLHGVVIRQLLATGSCEPAVLTAFLKDFSTLEEYKLTTTERSAVAAGLQCILKAAASDAEPKESAKYLDHLLDVLKGYRISFQSALSAVLALTERDSDLAKSLLMRLYDAGVGRRELLRQYLEFRHDDAALINILRHDPEVLKSEWLIKLLTDGETRANQFFLKIAVYFNESGGIAEQIRRALQDKIVKAPNVKLARPLATIAGKDMRSIWCEQDLAGDEHYKLAAALRANMHRARPAPDALMFGWRKAGMKAIAWRAMRCRPKQVTTLVQTLLQERVRRTVRLALALAQRTECAADIFSTAASIRPLAALRAALPYYRNLGETADPRVWEIVKPYISNVDLKSREGLRHVLKNVEWVPKTMKPEYCTVLYLVLDKISDRYANQVRRDMMECLPQVRDKQLKTVLLRILANIDAYTQYPVSFPAIFIRYLMLSKNENEEKSRFEEILKPFLKKIEVYREDKDEIKSQFFKENLEQIIQSLLYNAAFFDLKYNCSLIVIERVLNWISSFSPKETHFERYIHIHVTMLFFKAVRQSMEHKPEVFADPAKKESEGVELVGLAFGRNIAREVAEMKSKYFDSIIELYRSAFTKYLNYYFVYRGSKDKFLAAVTKGILSESVGSEGRLGFHIFRHSRRSLEASVTEEIRELFMRNKDKEVQFFAHAAVYT